MHVFKYLTTWHAVKFGYVHALLFFSLRGRKRSHSCAAVLQPLIASRWLARREMQFQVKTIATDSCKGKF